jgi:DNA-binding PadR family transcriptional regulator
MTRLHGAKRQIQVDDSPALLTDFSRFYILLLLFEGQKHGYQLMSSIHERLGQSVSPSLVYPFLRLLEKQGLVKYEKKSVGQKMRKVYSLTSSGRTLCNKLFRQFTTIVSTAIEPSMQVCAHCGCRVYKDAYFEDVEGRRTAFCCMYCARAYKNER